LRFRLQSIAVILLLVALSAQAQSAGMVRGTVSTIGDEKDRTYLAKIQVNLGCGGEAKLRTATTDDTGKFAFSEVPAGRCTLSVSDAQFEGDPSTVSVAEENAIEVDLRVRVRKVQQNVTVTADRPQVDTSSSDTAAPAVSQTSLQSAPLISERFQDALPLLPGVVRGPDGLINIKGARAGQSGILVNSASAIDPVTGDEAISLPLEAVASVKVLANPFSSEYGRFAGGVTEVETRSGTDEWKYLLTNFFPRVRVREGGIFGLESITPRVTVAGPLIKGKLYLFQSFDYRFVRVSVPSLPSTQQDQQFESFNSATRFDWSISDRQHLTGNLDFYPENTKFDLLNTFNPQEVTPGTHRRGYLLSLHETVMVGQNLLESSFSVKNDGMHVFPSSGLAGPMTLFPEQNSGTWYNRQDRDSRLYQWSQVLHIGNLKALGTHFVSVGYLVDHSNYDGTVVNQPVILLRENRTTSQVINFSRPAALTAGGNDEAIYVQDHWSPSQRASVDLGLRFERDSLAGSSLVVAPRFGFVIAPTRDNRTALRGGVGLFYDKIPLNVRTFLNYPSETVTSFGSNGSTVPGEPITFTHSLASPGLRLPYSVAWTLQLDREITRSVMLRLGYEERSTHQDFLVEPLASARSAQLELFNNGRQRYREFQGTVRWHVSERTSLYGGFVHSYAHGDLNTFEQFVGNFPTPVIRPNQFGPLPFDAPNRLLLWGSLGMPWKLEFWPLLDVHSGFPFSVVDDELNFAGRRDSRRFPAFASLDFQVIRPFQVVVFGRKHTLRAGLKVFNATNHFNPRDVQNNIFASDFGSFFNSVGTQFRAKLEFDF